MQCEFNKHTPPLLSLPHPAFRIFDTLWDGIGIVQYDYVGSTYQNRKQNQSIKLTLRERCESQKVCVEGWNLGGSSQERKCFLMSGGRIWLFRFHLFSFLSESIRKHLWIIYKPQLYILFIIYSFNKYQVPTMGQWCFRASESIYSAVPLFFPGYQERLHFSNMPMEFRWKWWEALSFLTIIYSLWFSYALRKHLRLLESNWET